MGVGEKTLDKRKTVRPTKDGTVNVNKLSDFLIALLKMISTPNNIIVIINAAGIGVSLLLLLLLVGTTKSHDLIMT